MLTQPTTLVYTIREAASLLTLGRSSMYNAVRNGSIPSVKLGRRLLIPRAALEQFLLKAGQPENGGA
jgi:excisionase family DNA binding protein